MACGLVIAGLPPLAGFLAKFALMDALVREEASAMAGWTVVVLLLLSGLATTIAFARAGVRIFWATQRAAPVIRLGEMAPVGVLLLLCIVLTVLANPVLGYLQEAAYALHAPGRYVGEVLGR
jgi:multicomponent K+:H+ antiporter subunit D